MSGFDSARASLATLVIVYANAICAAEAGKLSAPAEAPAGSSIDVGWSATAATGDFISIDGVGADERSYGPYAHTSAGNPVHVQVPDTPGDYQIRYHTGQSYKVIASRKVTVAPVTASLTAPNEVVAGRVFDVGWRGPDNVDDFITLVPAGTPQHNYGSSNGYTKRGNPVRIEAARTPGDYELRYLTGQSMNSLASVPVKITPDTTSGRLRVRSVESAAKPSFGAVELVLDASGSMLGRIQGQRRIDLARRALTDLLRELAPGTPLALRVFGDKEANSCRTDLAVPLAPLDVAKLSARINAVEPQNLAKTPIGASLEKVRSDLAGASAPVLVVLVTDGEETCDGDPKRAIESLRAANLDVRVNIVGFAIDEIGIKESFQQWAHAGNGSYFDAQNGAELAAAVHAALRSSFEVLDGDRVVASGVVDGEPVDVAPGTYRVRVVGTAREAKSVKVEAGAIGELRL